MVRTRAQVLKDTIANYWSNKKYDLAYIVEPAEWVIKREGQSITDHLNKSKILQAKITTSHLGLRNQIVHFGSLSTFLTARGIRKPHHSNKIVATFFHLEPDNPRIKFVQQATKYADLFHTACQITKRQLVKLGLPESKVIVIPLGIDLSLFPFGSHREKRKIRKELNLPLNPLIIGSFQKDGIGWGEGLEPKLIKGPDIFVKVVSRLKKYRPFVLLTGPARGFVKKELNKEKIPYKHFFLKNYQKIYKLYNALDLYLITSRIEGGPKAILEAWASGVPIVSTAVGMVPDIGKNAEDVLIVLPNDIQKLTAKAVEVIQNDQLKQKLIRNGLEKVKAYDWKNITQKYYKELYQTIKPGE